MRALPEPVPADVAIAAYPNANAPPAALHHSPADADEPKYPITPITGRLHKRKGGGGGRSGGSRTSRPTTGGTKPSTPKTPSPGTSRSSNAGGYSSGGTGPAPRYTGTGGKKFYSGGGSAPYRSGSRTPSGLSAVALPAALMGGVFAGLWLGSLLYMYAWTNPLAWQNPLNARALVLPYLNSTAGNATQQVLTVPGGGNVTLPVTCLCEENAVCGCDEVHDEQFVAALLQDAASGGDAAGKTVRLSVVNGTLTVVINGTLPNGTTADGGSDYAAGAAAGPRWAITWVVVAVAGAVVAGVV